MWTVGLIALGAGFILGMVVDNRARKVLAEIQGLLTRVEVRLARLENAVESGLKELRN